MKIGDRVHNGRLYGEVIGYWPEHGTMRVEIVNSRGVVRQTTSLITDWKLCATDYEEDDQAWQQRRKARRR